MGEKNSTLTRVQPLFKFINKDEEKLNQLFKLFNNKEIENIKKDYIKEIRYGTDEKSIPASKSRLLWMLNNKGGLTMVTNYGANSKKSTTFTKREQLFLSDQETLCEAICKIKNVNNVPKSGWYIFEGYTNPDIYIETTDSIFVGEAKRTERDITTKTKWSENRDQLIRHIDALLDQKKKIYSFYILDKIEFDKGIYPKRMKQYSDEEYFKANLPHRDDKLVKRAKESFIGYIFWQQIEKLFDITFPNTI